MASRREFLKHSQQKLRQRRWQRRSLFWGTFFVLLVSAFAAAGRWERLLIKQILVTGNKVVADSAIKTAADEFLAGEILGVWPRRNFLFLPRKRLAEVLTDRFARLAAVELSLTEADELLITVREREALAIWCPAGEGECRFMDQAGVAFAPALFFSNYLFFEIQTPPLILPAAGGAILDQSTVDRLFDLRDRLAEVLKTVWPQAAIVKAVAAEAGDWRLTAAFPEWEIFLNQRQDPAALAAALAAALQAPAFREAATAPPLEYLDFRFLPKVFYKLL